MNYKGGDMDLRVPHTPHAWEWGPEEAGEGRYLLRETPVPTPEMAGESIWVDAILLTCCNYAFDIAAAHRWAEVQVLHLLNAMSRIEGAAMAMEARGIRVFGLRRATNELIVQAAAPHVPTAASAHPRRSAGLERVLRRAAVYAARREPAQHAPAVQVDDVLNVLLSEPPCFEGAHVLAAYADTVREETVFLPGALPPGPHVPVPHVPVMNRLDSGHGVRPGSFTLQGPGRKAAGEFALQRAEEVIEHGVGIGVGIDGAGGTRSAGAQTSRQPDNEPQQSRDDRGAQRQAFMEGFAGFAGKLAALEGRMVSREDLAGLASRADLTAALAPLSSELVALREALHAHTAAALQGAGAASGGQKETLSAIEAVRQSLSEHRAKMRETLASVNARLEALPVLARTMETLSQSLVPQLAQVARQREEIITAFSAAARSLNAAADARREGEAGALHTKLVDTLAGVEQRLGEVFQEISRVSAAAQELVRQIEPLTAAQAAVLPAPAVAAPNAVADNPRETLLLALEQKTTALLHRLDELAIQSHPPQSHPPVPPAAAVLRETTENLPPPPRRFWYWLFGTDDWRAASWKSRSLPPGAKQGEMEGR